MRSEDTFVRLPPHLPGVELVRGRTTQPYPPHVSLTAKVALIRGGSKLFRYRGRTWTAPPNALILLDAGEVHEGRPVARPFDLWMLSVEPGLLATVTGFRETVTTDRLLARRFSRLCDAIADVARSPLVVEEAFEHFVGDLRVRACGQPRREPARPREPGPVSRAREMLHALYADAITLDDLARASRLPKPRFLRAFKHWVGLSPHQYQVQIRVDHAKRMIAAGAPLAEVAAAAGFFDQSHLHRHFTRVVGLSPGAYQRGSQ